MCYVFVNATSHIYLVHLCAKRQWKPSFYVCLVRTLPHVNISPPTANGSNFDHSGGITFGKARGRSSLFVLTLTLPWHSTGHPVRHSSGVRPAAHLLHPPVSGEAPQPLQHRAHGRAPHRNIARTLRSVISRITWLRRREQFSLVFLASGCSAKAEPPGAGMTLLHFGLMPLNMFIF